MNWILITLLIAAITSGCGTSAVPPAAPNEPAVSAVASETIASGSLSELTENNFRPGLDYRFSQEELAVWQDLLDNLDGTAVETPSQTAEDHYLIRLYDNTDSEITCFSLAYDGCLYTEDGRQVKSETVTKLLNTIIADQSNTAQD